LQVVGPNGWQWVVSVAALVTLAGGAALQGAVQGATPSRVDAPTDAADRYLVGPTGAEGIEASLKAAGLGASLQRPSAPSDLSPAAARVPRLTAVWKAEDLWPLSCQQAWETSGRSPSGMTGIVRALARVALTNRELLFPDTREAGLDAGKGIAEDCTEDPAGLLFAIVDKHVRRVAEAAASPRQ
jgi:hypothetical protein